jgi:hypothetical protein
MSDLTQAASSFAIRLMAAWLLALCAVLAMPAAKATGTGEACGAETQLACPVTARLPSCDYNLVETADHTCARPACGAEGQAPCAATARVILDPVLKTLVPQPCDVNLKLVGGVCVHPGCGREGQGPCPVWERVPSCDLDLVERPFRACERPACGRLGEAPCDLPLAALRQGRSCDINLVAVDGLCQRPVMPPSVAETVRNVVTGVKTGVVGAARTAKQGTIAAVRATAQAGQSASKAVVGAARAVKAGAAPGGAQEIHGALPVEPAPQAPAATLPPPPPAPRAGTVLQTSASLYRTDQLVVVDYSGMPGTKHDWITIVPADAPNDAYGEWAWLGETSGTHRFGRLLKPGRYQVRAFENWPAGQFTIKGRVDFEVR